MSVELTNPREPRASVRGPTGRSARQFRFLLDIIDPTVFDPVGRTMVRATLYAYASDRAYEVIYPVDDKSQAGMQYEVAWEQLYTIARQEGALP